MTEYTAKELSLEIWEYLRDNPNMTNKYELPIKIYSKISCMKGNCPLCELFCDYDCNPKCPLDCINNDKSDYRKWSHSETKNQRAKYASKIVETIKAWNV